MIALELVVIHPTKVFLATGILLAIALTTASKIEVNSRVMEAYSEDHPFSKQMRAVEDEMFGY